MTSGRGGLWPLHTRASMAEVSDQQRKSAGGILSSSALLIVSRLSVQVASALSTAVVARSIAVEDFGNLNAGLAIFYLTTALCDWGFGLSLARRLGQGDSRDGIVVRSIARLQTVWSGCVACCAVLYAIFSGWNEPRMRILLVLAPAIAATGVSVYRQVLIANGKTHQIVIPGLIFNFGAATATIILALNGFGIMAMAVVVCCSAVLSSLALFRFGRQQISKDRGTRRLRRRVRREVVPLGLQSFLSSAYFTIDVVILGYLVSGTELGRYTAAVKILSFVILIPGIIAQVSVIGFSRVHQDEMSTMDLQIRSWKWLSFAFLPAVVLILLYAPIAVNVYFGSRFVSITPLVRILMLASVIVAISNTIFGAMIARSRQRWLVIQGVFCLALNVSLNVLLIPHFGIAASAWITVVTELVVALGMTIALSRHGIFPYYLIRAWRYYIAIIFGTIPPWLLWGDRSPVGLCASTLLVFAMFLVMRLIPEELRDLRSQRSRKKIIPAE